MSRGQSNQWHSKRWSQKVEIWQAGGGAQQLTPRTVWHWVSSHGSHNFLLYCLNDFHVNHTDLLDLLQLLLWSMPASYAASGVQPVWVTCHYCGSIQSILIGCMFLYSDSLLENWSSWNTITVQLIFSHTYSSILYILVFGIKFILFSFYCRYRHHLNGQLVLHAKCIGSFVLPTTQQLLPSLGLRHSNSSPNLIIFLFCLVAEIWNALSAFMKLWPEQTSSHQVWALSSVIIMMHFILLRSSFVKHY